MNKLFIIDASSYIFRSFYALPVLNNSIGIPTNASYGFLKMLKNTINIYNPSYLLMAMDAKEETFRKKMFKNYKANREKTPPELNAQIPSIEKIIDAFNITCIKMPGFEADDIIATVTEKFKKDLEIVIISGDKDLMQLIDEKTTMIDTMKNKTYTPEKVIEKFSVSPNQIIDFLAIMGDSSDNIPGVKGIGEKGAAKLINEFGSLENIYKNINNIKNLKHKEALSKYKEDAFLSKELVTLKKDLEINIDKEKIKFKNPDADKLHSLYKELEFIKELKELNFHESVKAVENIKKINDYTAVYNNELVGYDILSNLTFNEISKYNKIFDIKIASYVLNPGKREYLLEDISLITTGLNYTPSNLPNIKEKLENEIKSKNLDKVLYEIDLPSIKVLKNIEETGFFLDKDKLLEFKDSLEAKIINLTNEIYKTTGEFNINSPKQLSTVLFEKFNLPTIKKIDSGYSTDQDVLEELSKLHPLPKLILEYREVTKLQNTYIIPLLKEASKGDGRVRTKYHLDITSTGRLSSSNPNLQNIPIRTNLGAKIRESFIAEKGKVLISADYSQLELVICAHLSSDPIMTESFNKGEDIHLRTAAEIFEIPVEMVTSDYRRQAKAINFGIMYGKTPFGLAKELGISQQVATKIIKRYFDKYKNISLFRKFLISEARKNGFSKTLFGRIRYLPDINSTNKAKREFAERNAINAPIQGTAADIMKIAMINIWKKIPKDTKIILQVHDEFLIETPISRVNEISNIIKHEMENAVSLTPGLRVNISSGNNWLEAHS